MLNFKVMKRYCILLTGLFLMGLGISLITKSELGTSPISSIPYVLSMIFPLTFGQFTFLLCLLCILIEMVLLRKDFPKIQLLQIIVAMCFGLFVDFGMFLLTPLNPSFYAEKIVMLLLGCIVLAGGVYLEVSADVLLNPGEGAVKAIARKTGKAFGHIKVAFDFSLFLIALATSLFVFGQVKGLREGTIISALLVGFIVKAISAIFKRFDLEKWITD